MDPLHVSVTPMAGGVNIDIDLTLFIQLGLFLVLMLLLNKMIFQPFLKSIELREQKTGKAREDAAALQARAESLSEEYRETIQSARADAAGERQDLRLEGLSAKESQVSAARSEASETLSAAQAKASAQFDAARTALLEDVDSLSEKIVGKVLGRGV